MSTVVEKPIEDKPVEVKPTVEKQVEKKPISNVNPLYAHFLDVENYIKNSIPALGYIESHYDNKPSFDSTKVSGAQLRKGNKDLTQEDIDYLKSITDGSQSKKDGQEVKT